MPSEDDLRVRVSRAGHDLNNACASMLGFSALTLEELDTDSPLRLYLTEIEAAAQRASRIAEDLLTLSKQL